MMKLPSWTWHAVMFFCALTLSVGAQALFLGAASTLDVVRVVAGCIGLGYAGWHLEEHRGT